MAWNTLFYFDFQWKDLLAIKASQSDSGIPNLTKNIKVMKWAQTIIAFWNTYIGARNVPLTYLIREDPAVTHPPPALEIDRQYSAPNDSIYSELVERVTHIHALFTTDNQVWPRRGYKTLPCCFCSKSIQEQKIWKICLESYHVCSLFNRWLGRWNC